MAAYKSRINPSAIGDQFFIGFLARKEQKKSKPRQKKSNSENQRAKNANEKKNVSGDTHHHCGRRYRSLSFSARITVRRYILDSIESKQLAPQEPRRQLSGEPQPVRERDFDYYIYMRHNITFKFSFSPRGHQTNQPTTMSFQRLIPSFFFIILCIPIIFPRYIILV